MKIKIKKPLQGLLMQIPYRSKHYKEKEETLNNNYREKWINEE